MNHHISCSTLRPCVVTLMLTCIAAETSAVQLTGHLTPATGEHSSHYAVTLSTDDGKRYVARIDQLGGFHVDDLPSGHYAVMASMDDNGSTLLRNIDLQTDHHLDIAIPRNGRRVSVQLHRHGAADDDVVITASRLVGLRLYPLVIDSSMPMPRITLSPGHYLFQAHATTWQGQSVLVSLAEADTMATVHIYDDRPENPALADELKKMLNDDQSARLITHAQADGSPELTAALKDAVFTDFNNRKRLKEIIATGGWPSADQVGLQGVSAALMLLVHGPACEVARQLPVLRRAADNGELAWKSLALAIDKTMLDLGELQPFGTQLSQDASGALEVRDIDSEMLVDARRRAIGLGPLTDYRQSLQHMIRGNGDSEVNDLTSYDDERDSAAQDQQVAEPL